MKKKYIKPVAVVITTDSGQLLAGSLGPNKGAHHAAAKEQGMISNVAEGDSSSVIGWVKPHSVWDD